MMFTSTNKILAGLASSGLALASLDCRPEGPVLPKPKLTSLESSSIVAKAADNLSSILDKAIDGSIKAGWDTTNSSFSLALVSLDQEDAGVPLWEYHHLAEANTEGTKEIGRDSQYLIGSISKSISDFIMLQVDIDIDAPVTEYLPDLAKSESKIDWEDVTLRMLGSHLAGVPANYGFSEYYFLKEVFLSYGLPPIQDSAYPPCGVTGLNDACSADQFIMGMRNSYPVTAPNDRPAYSNIAFTIMVMALENVTGKNYTQLVEEHFSEPLGLKSTRPSPGDDEKAVIPPGENTWGADYGMNAPGGGLVSSLSDLSKFAHGILTRTIGQSESQIRGWLKPSTFAGSMSSSVGLSWEIYRSSNLTPDHPHPVTIYGKGGGAFGYRSQLSIVDEYGIALIILTAGPAEALPPITTAMMSTLIPAVDEASREEAKEQLAVVFESSGSSSSSSSKRDNSTSSIVAKFSLDDDSLVLDELKRDDHDIAAALVDIWSLSLGQVGLPVDLPIRLFPTEMKDETTLDDVDDDEDHDGRREKCKRGNKVTREVWTFWPSFNTESESELHGQDAWDDNCVTWTMGDWVHYGSEPVDRVLFYRDEEGDIVGFEAPFLRSGVMTKV